MNNQYDLEGWVKVGKRELARISKGGGPPARQRSQFNRYRKIINQVDVMTNDELGLWPWLITAGAWLWRVKWAALGLAAIGTTVFQTAGTLTRQSNAIVRDAGEVIRALMWAGGAIAAYWMADKVISGKKPTGTYQGY